MTVDPPHPAIPLGPFDLHARIGRGGMGEVWRGIHRAQVLPVAVKVITASHARKQHFVEAFRREVQTVAGLDHPTIVTVLDVGTVGEAAEAASGGALVSGSPYLAMELASAGSLVGPMHRGELGWAAIETVLRSLLDALAHAHARGVIHRDLKPGNVLRSDPTKGGGPGWRLTDFGIAHALEQQTRSGSVEQSLGTPSYMAPEQIRGRWRDYGPWTDLYALGCLAWALVCGEAPFVGGEPREIADRHLAESPPAFVPRVPVPEGFEIWLRGLLRKRIEERFQRAADAAWALLSLGPVRGDVRGAPGAVRVSREKPTLAPRSRKVDRTAPLSVEDAQTGTVLMVSPVPTVLMTEGSEEISRDTLLVAKEAVLLRGGEPEPEPPVGMVSSRAPVPASWKRPVVDGSPSMLMGAGLGLYGLRTIPLAGRVAARDALWSALRSVVADRSARARILSGPAGTGKSRLAQWVCQRAHEVGAASVLKVTCDQARSLASGLPRMVARQIQAVGLEGEPLVRRCERVLRRMGRDDPWQWETLAELIDGASVGTLASGPRLGLSSARDVRLTGFVEAVCWDRPVVLWVDDVQWGTDPLRFVETLMASQDIRPLPVLVLMTVQEEALAEQPHVGARLDRLRSVRGVESLTVGPLGRSAQRQLVSDLLGLDTALASAVVERSGGNPLFAVQLVGDWVQRGILRAGATGFELVAEAEDALPDDLHRVWSERVARLLEGRNEEDRVALEIAAALGQSVDIKEWSLASEHEGAVAHVALVDALVGRRLAQWTEGGWSFVHGMLRESLLRLADEAGRLTAHHAACAEMLLERDRGGVGLQSRVGLHLFEAGRFEDALEPLMAAALEAQRRGDYGVVLDTLTRRDRALEAARIGAPDMRWATGQRLRARVEGLQGQFEEALERSDNILGDIDGHGLDALRAGLLCDRGEMILRVSSPERAASHFEAAEAVFAAIGDRRGWIQATEGLGSVAFGKGDAAEAEARFLQALQAARELGDEEREATLLRRLAEAALLDERWEHAEALFDRALDVQQRRGNRYPIAAILNGLAEIHRFTGRLDDAEAKYRQALDLFVEMGSSEAVITRINIALVRIARGRYSAAREDLEALLAHLEDTGQSTLLGGVHAELLPCVAAAGDWAAFDRHLGQARTFLDISGVADPDDAWPAQLAGDLARAARQPDRARRAWKLARRLWHILGRVDKLDEIDRAMMEDTP